MIANSVEWLNHARINPVAQGHRLRRGGIDFLSRRDGGVAFKPILRCSDLVASKRQYKLKA